MKNLNNRYFLCFLNRIKDLCDAEFTCRGFSASHVGLFIFWSWLTAQQKAEQNLELRDIVDLAFAAGVIMMLYLTVNSLAFFKGIYTEWLMEIQAEVWAGNGHLMKSRVNRLHLLVDQFNLFAGTGLSVVDNPGRYFS